MDTAGTSTSSAWRTSTYTREGNCVQLAELEAGVIGIRDSKDPNDWCLPLTHTALTTLLNQIKTGTFDLEPWRLTASQRRT